LFLGRTQALWYYLIPDVLERQNKSNSDAKNKIHIKYKLMFLSLIFLKLRLITKSMMFEFEKVLRNASKYIFPSTRLKVIFSI